MVKFLMVYFQSYSNLPSMGRKRKEKRVGKEMWSKRWGRRAFERRAGKIKLGRMT